MARRTIVTARQERLGAELRKLRERVGVTAREAAQVIGFDQAKMSHLEAGRVAAGEERLRRLAAHYGVLDAGLVDALVAMDAERLRGWWEKYRGLVVTASLDLAALEWHAKSLQSLQTMHVPGLLQTEAYMRALFRYLSSDFAPSDLEAVIEFRARRQGVLDRECPPPFTAIVHEAALRVLVGGRKVAREQLDVLLERSECPHVTVRVVPFSADGFAGMGYSMLYASSPVQQLDTVQVDHVHGSVFLDAEEQLGHYRDRWSTVELSALGPGETRDFIRRIARDLEE
ncbi:helix-turn-helix transcriptional regulator [Streptomyces sp. NPDC026206]|uniref:helix-turn-helix domain-containing protein n=1 Tax=Streptomyces sp. NPDC026206 TaxID=3157089 RepID=UPI0034034EF5